MLNAAAKLVQYFILVMLFHFNEISFPDGVLWIENIMFMSNPILKLGYHTNPNMYTIQNRGDFVVGSV